MSTTDSNNDEVMIVEMDDVSNVDDGIGTIDSVGNVNYDWTSEQHINFANICLLNEQYDVAIDSYARAEAALMDKKNDNNSNPEMLVQQFRIYSFRSQAFYQLQRYNDSYDDITKAISIVQSDIFPVTLIIRGETEQCWKRYGLTSYQVGGKYDESIYAFEQAQQLSQLNNRSNTTKSNDYAEWIVKCQRAMNKYVTGSLLKDDEQLVIEDVTNETGQVMKTAAAAAAASATDTSPAKPYVVPKYQYYQDDQFMKIEIFTSEGKDKLDIDIATDQIIVTIRNGNQDYTIICGTLFDEIDPTKSKTIYKADKTLIKLRKVKAPPNEWYELIKKESPIGKTTSQRMPLPRKIKKGTDENLPTTTATATNTSSDAQSHPATAPSVANPTSSLPPPIKARPYASTKDWNTIEKTILQEDEKDSKPVGDDAMNVLFGQIYANADPDTRRAMIKSYQTSGGTVLSTNWNEVAKTDYEQERTAPKGMEWKNWEGKKLPMKDD